MGSGVRHPVFHGPRGLGKALGSRCVRWEGRRRRRWRASVVLAFHRRLRGGRRAGSVPSIPRGSVRGKLRVCQQVCVCLCVCVILRKGEGEVGTRSGRTSTGAHTEGGGDEELCAQQQQQQRMHLIDVLYNVTYFIPASLFQDDSLALPSSSETFTEGGRYYQQHDHSLRVCSLGQRFLSHPFLPVSVPTSIKPSSTPTETRTIPDYLTYNRSPSPDRRHRRCVEYTSPSCKCHEGDSWKLFSRLDDEEGAGITGAILTVLVRAYPK